MKRSKQTQSPKTSLTEIAVISEDVSVNFVKAEYHSRTSYNLVRNQFHDKIISRDLNLRQVFILPNYCSLYVVAWQLNTLCYSSLQ